MITFRPYQKEIIVKAIYKLNIYQFVYLAMEVRTGKTLTSLGIAQQLEVNNVLFITKKKAIKSIQDDYDKLNPNYNIYVINYESLHKAPKTKWDFIVIDEAHTLGAYPKPNKRAQAVNKLIKKHRSYVCVMSGTPTPESYSQMYHQVYGIPKNPFNNYVNFYKFANHYVHKTQKIINSFPVNNYDNGKITILEAMNKHIIRFSQVDAGFEVKTDENILYVTLNENTRNVIQRLKKEKVVGNYTTNKFVLGDTPVKLMQKLHQLYSGTVKFEDGSSMVIDHSKAEFIKKHFKGKKIAIFYKFKAELVALQDTFQDDLTTELSLFKETNKNIALQIVSGREGISLSDAECLVYYNIDFSATSYLQSKDRMTTKNRKENKIYWIFSEKGIENKIYKAVTKKKDYTLQYFKRDFLTL